MRQELAPPRVFQDGPTPGSAPEGGERGARSRGSPPGVGGPLQQSNWLKVKTYSLNSSDLKHKAELIAVINTSKVEGENRSARYKLVMVMG